MSDNALKKEFRPSDVERIRNLVNKDYTSKTKYQSGYKRTSNRHKEGDVWVKNKKTWTIKDGIKQTISKMDAIKKEIFMPLCCPKCGKVMKGQLDKHLFLLLFS